MSFPPMDPYYEQRLRDEVIYLHSLWHQGPPRPAASTSAPAAVVRLHLQPSVSTQFKNKKKRKRQNRKKPNNPAPESNSSPGAEWPCPTPSPSPSTTGWPSMEANPDPKPPMLSPEDQSKLAAKAAHQHALKVVHEFFASNNADDSDVMDSSSDEEDELMEEDCGREEYSFFFKVFKEDTELREYYEKNFAKGEFSCLVCGAVGGKNLGKKFKGCLPLVQHSITIAKTKKRKAHRAFGQAVCKVLGWDVDHLPSVASMLSDNLGDTQGNVSSDSKESSMTFVNNADSVKDHTLESKNDEAMVETGYIGSGMSSDGEKGDTNSLTCHDAGKNLQDLGMVCAHNAEEPASDGQTILSVASIPEKATGWPSLEPIPNLEPPLFSSEEQSKLAAIIDHQYALKVVREFFISNDADDSDATDSSSDEDDELVEEDYGRKVYSFFFNVFTEDTKLREYYAKNFAKGEFSCLVCRAVGGTNSWKKFKGCLPLVQHSITVAKTKKRKAHRAFGQAVCKVLGWDIDHLPAIASMLSDNLGETQGTGSSDNKESSMTLVNNVDSEKDDTLESKNDEAVPETGYIGSGTLSDGDKGDMNSLTCPDAGKDLQDPGVVHTHNVEPASDGQRINSVTCPNADKNLENLGMLQQHGMEEPAYQGLKINSLACADANRNLENHDVVNPDYVEDTTTEWLTTGDCASG